VIANQNINKAQLYGISGNITAEIPDKIKFFTTINYTVGRLNPGSVNETPLDHIPPLYGKISVSHNNKFLQTELYALYNGWKKLKNYNPSGEDNLQYATIEGTPSWITLNLKANATLFKPLSLQAGIENILNRNYRHFASGLSAPGRNFTLALRSTF
jgi:hemoglobin/transferrin/lactoferrin receptor protein